MRRWITCRTHRNRVCIKASHFRPVAWRSKKAIAIPVLAWYSLFHTVMCYCTFYILQKKVQLQSVWSEPDAKALSAIDISTIQRHVKLLQLTVTRKHMMVICCKGRCCTLEADCISSGRPFLQWVVVATIGRAIGYRSKGFKILYPWYGRL